MKYPEIYNFKTPDRRDYRCFVDDVEKQEGADNSGPRMERGIIKSVGNVKTYFTKPKTLPILSLWPLINGVCVVLLATSERTIMAKSDTPDTLPKNKMGGLNLNWAISQALAKFGVNAKIGDVREFISVNYGPAGKKAIKNEGSLSTGLSAMRKKMKGELNKVPPVPVNGGRVVAPQATPRPDVIPLSEVATERLSSFTERFTALKPSLSIVVHYMEASRCTDLTEALTKIKQAIAEVEACQKTFGKELEGIVKLVMG